MKEIKNYCVTVGYGDEYWDAGWDEYYFDTFDECKNFVIEQDGYFEKYDDGLDGATLYNYGMIEIKKIN